MKDRLYQIRILIPSYSLKPFLLIKIRKHEAIYCLIGFGIGVGCCILCQIFKNLFIHNSNCKKYKSKNITNNHNNNNNDNDNDINKNDLNKCKINTFGLKNEENTLLIKYKSLTKKCNNDSNDINLLGYDRKRNSNYINVHDNNNPYRNEFTNSTYLLNCLNGIDKNNNKSLFLFKNISGSLDSLITLNNAKSHSKDYIDICSNKFNVCLSSKIKKSDSDSALNNLLISALSRDSTTSSGYCLSKQNISSNYKTNVINEYTNSTEKLIDLNFNNFNNDAEKCFEKALDHIDKLKEDMNDICSDIDLLYKNKSFRRSNDSINNYYDANFVNTYTNIDDSNSNNNNNNNNNQINDNIKIKDNSDFLTFDDLVDWNMHDVLIETNTSFLHSKSSFESLIDQYEKDNQNKISLTRTNSKNINNSNRKFNRKSNSSIFERVNKTSNKKSRSYKRVRNKSKIYFCNCKCNKKQQNNNTNIFCSNYFNLNDSILNDELLSSTKSNSY